MLYLNYNTMKQEDLNIFVLSIRVHNSHTSTSNWIIIKADESNKLENPQRRHHALWLLCCKNVPLSWQQLVFIVVELGMRYRDDPPASKDTGAILCNWDSA